jgi:hypothetical protein
MPKQGRCRGVCECHQRTLQTTFVVSKRWYAGGGMSSLFEMDGIFEPKVVKDLAELGL